MKKSQKKYLIIGIIVAIILILVILFSSLVGSKTIKAQLIVENPDVYVNENIVQNDMELRQGDIIKTSESGLATVVLYESIIINLESDTQITLDKLVKEHPEISQQQGETWNKFTKLFGVKDYTVTTGNSVASVRGTAFGIKDNFIIVPEGLVEYTLDGENFQVANNVVELIQGKINQRDLTEEDRIKIKAKLERTIRNIKVLRIKEAEKKEKLLSFIGSRYNITMTNIKEEFEKADRGESDLRVLRDRAPIKIEATEKIIQMTDVIKELRDISNSL